jgi:hypothetical protein
MFAAGSLVAGQLVQRQGLQAMTHDLLEVPADDGWLLLLVFLAAMRWVWRSVASRRWGQCSTPRDISPQTVLIAATPASRAVVTFARDVPRTARTMTRSRPCT